MVSGRLGWYSADSDGPGIRPTRMLSGRLAGGWYLADSDGISGRLGYQRFVVSAGPAAVRPTGRAGFRVIGRASADGRSASTRLPAWVGCIVKTVYGPDNVLAQLSTTSPARTLRAQVDPDSTGTGTGPTTSESTPPALPPVPPGPLRTSVPDGALTVTGAPGCRRCRRTVPTSVPRMCMCERLQPFVPPYTAFMPLSDG